MLSLVAEGQGRAAATSPPEANCPNFLRVIEECVAKFLEAAMDYEDYFLLANERGVMSVFAIPVAQRIAPIIISWNSGLSHVSLTWPSVV